MTEDAAPGGGRRISLWTRVVVASVAALVALVLAFTVGGPSGPDSMPANAPDGEAPAAQAPATPGPEEIAAQLAAVARREPGDPLALGEVDAPVVMVSYADFQCPYCARYARDTAPALVERFVADGTLRIEWRDFPYLGEASTTAALAGRAAADQGAFWAFHDALYAAEPSEHPQVLGEEALVALAGDLDLDVERFRTVMRAPETAAAVQEDLAEGQALGVTGTPAFLVNGQPLLGAHDEDVFAQVIQAAAADVG